jgi:hypothetical protein
MLKAREDPARGTLAQRDRTSQPGTRHQDPRQRDTAKYHRETAAAIDEEADWLRHELEVLNFARPQIDVPERRA